MPDTVLPKGFALPPDLVVGAWRGRRGIVNDYECRDTTLDIDVVLTEYFPRAVAVRHTDYTVGPRESPVAPLSSDDKLYSISDDVLLRGTQGGDASPSGIYAWGLQQFMQEAATLAQLNHPNITRVFRAFRHNGTAYMTTQLVRGSSLQNAVKTHDFSQDELDDIAAHAIDALSLLHSNGLHHRDLTPESVLIRADDGAPVLTNFASVAAQRWARDNDSDDQQQTRIIPRHYAAPEAFLAKPGFGPGVDIYGLAACLCYAVTKLPPPPLPERLSGPALDLAAEAPKGRFRASFLKAIEQGLAVRPSDRPASLALWRAALLDSSSKIRIPGRQIFISYRRADTASAAHALYRRLQEAFGPERIFFDVDTIPPGEDFRRHIERCMDRSAVCIALVGKRWLRRRSWTDWLRRHREPDHVAIEIELALTAQVPIIPVLVAGARMPASSALPGEIAEFAYINARAVQAEPTAGELQHLASVIANLLDQRSTASHRNG